MKVGCHLGGVHGWEEAWAHLARLVGFIRIITNGWWKSCVFVGGMEFRVGDRDRIRALVSKSVSGANVLLLESSVVSLLRVVHCLGARNWGLREGSVVLH